jgi:hypothetical protein
VNEDGVFCFSKSGEREKEKRKTMLAEGRSFKPDDRVEAMSEACYNKRRNTLENPTSRIPTHNGRENERDEGMSRQGKKKETKTTNGNVPNVVVNDDNSGGERGKEGGERRGQSLLAMMERISVPFFFFLQTPFLRFGGGAFPG